MKSSAGLLASLPPAQRRKALEGFAPEQLDALLYDWRFWARPSQLPPAGSWRVWVILAGRGFGKTRAGAEWAIQKARDLPGSHGALVAKTPADARDVMIEGGESSILKISPPDFRPVYEVSKRRLTWPNGSWGTVYSSHEYETLRGPQHHWAWADEFCAWEYPRETWEMLMMGLRLGDNPQCVVTTTPKPITVLKEILAQKGTVATKGSSYENRANLADAWFEQIINRYEGTSLGAQEIYAEIMGEVTGALWKRDLFERYRILEGGEQPPVDLEDLLARLPQSAIPIVRAAVAIDPAGRAEEESNETGIIGGALGRDGHAYIFADQSGQYSPLGWATKAVQVYDRFRCDRVLAEENQGGDMVQKSVRDAGPHVSYRGVWASIAKQARAQPIALKYEKGLVHHVGRYPDLEDQCCIWVPVSGAPSPDRLDGLVWLLSDLFNVAQVATPHFEDLSQESYYRSA